MTVQSSNIETPHVDKKQKMSTSNREQDVRLLQKISRDPSLALTALMELLDRLEGANAEAAVDFMAKTRSRVGGVLTKNRKLRGKWKLVENGGGKEAVGYLTLAVARNPNKMVLKDFYIDECGPCDMSEPECDAHLESLVFPTQIRVCGKYTGMEICIDTSGDIPTASVSCDDYDPELPHFDELLLCRHEP